MAAIIRLARTASHRFHRLTWRTAGCRWLMAAALVGSLATAADVAVEPAPPPPADPAVLVTPAAPAVDTEPQLVFLLDHLYAKSGWNGELQVPYRPDLSVRLVDLLTPDEAQHFTRGETPAAVFNGFRDAERKIAGGLSAAYIQQLRQLAAQLPAADQPLATRLIDGMVAYQTSIYQPNRLFGPVITPRAAGTPEELEREQLLALRTRNEAWMKSLSAADLTRVLAYFASRKPDAGAGFYDGTVQLHIGRWPVRLSDLFDAPADFRRQERAVDLAWKRQLSDTAHAWQKSISTLRSIAAQQQVAQVRAELRPGLVAVLQAAHSSLVAQQALQHQYEIDQLDLLLPALAADRRAELERRRDGHPNAMRAIIEGYGRDLEAAWTAPLEKAFIDFYTRTKRLDYVKDHLHQQGREVLEQAVAPNGDQF